MVIIPLIAWLPLFLLSVAEGRAAGGVLTIPFLYDIEVHARYLIALPLLIAAELMVHLRIRPAVEQFLQRGIVPAEARPRFDAIVVSATRLRNSVAVELILLVSVYIAGHYIWRQQHPLSAATWFASMTDSGLRLTWAGSWYADQHPRLPVHPSALVFPAVHMDPVPLAGLEARSPSPPHAPGPRRGPRIPR